MGSSASARPRVAVVGAGGWGTTIACLVARREPVALLARSAAGAERLAADRENRAHLPGVAFPQGLVVSADPAEALATAELVVMAVPSAHLRAVARLVGPALPAGVALLSLVKGLEPGTLLRMSEVIADATGVPPRRIAVLSGPNLAPEVARGLPASAVVAAEDPALAREIVERIGTRRFRLYVNRDVVGVEIAGAFKNVIAIAAGAAEELGFGDNGKAALITRGLAELIRLGVAAGADPLTFAGLAGVGDIVATCSSPLSRNHRLGVELARGRRWEELRESLGGVAEGAHTVDAAIALGERLGVELPIAREVHAALFEGKSVERCVVALLAREGREEARVGEPGRR